MTSSSLLGACFFLKLLKAFCAAEVIHGVVAKLIGSAFLPYARLRGQIVDVQALLPVASWHLL